MQPFAGSQTDECAGRPPCAVQGLDYADRIRSGSVLFQNGRNDQAVPAWRAEQLHRAPGPSHMVTWYESGHALPAQARIDAFSGSPNASASMRRRRKIAAAANPPVTAGRS